MTKDSRDVFMPDNEGPHQPRPEPRFGRPRLMERLGRRGVSTGIDQSARPLETADASLKVGESTSDIARAVI